MLNIIKKELKIILLSFIIATLFLLSASVIKSKNYSTNIQGGIAEEVIRFHVVANSNSQEDQELKMEVRSKVLEEISYLTTNSTSKEETIEIITENFAFLEEVSKNTLMENGNNQQVKISYVNEYFPLKTYGDMTFPSGEYDALKVEIGNSVGENFWCVMYPSLCFVDETMEDVENETYDNLKNILSTEEYSVIMKENSTNLMPKIKFKIVDLWQKK